VTPIRSSPRAGALRAALLLLVTAACATAPARGPGRGARAALEALAVRGDAAEAAARTPALVARSPADPWARLSAALLARRALDPAEETAALVALVAGAPAHPLAALALRRLSELPDDSPAVARAVEEGIAPLQPRLAGLAAYRARVARIAAAEVLGDHERAALLRAENGAIAAWTLAGPFGTRRALDFVRAFPPDGGTLPEAAPAPLGGPPRPTRTILAPDGTVAIEGEPGDGAVLYLAADVTLGQGGRYLLTVGTSMSARVQLDGALVHERRDFAAHLPAVVHVPVALAPGTHRVLVKTARGDGDRSALHVALAREDGAPSDASAAPVAPGAPPPAAPAPSVGEPVHGAGALAAALEPEAGPALARLLAGMDAVMVDREAAKGLLGDAVAALPASALARVARAGVLAADPTLDEQVGRSRAEADLREALARDPGHAAARVSLAALLREAGRLDDAAEVLDATAAGASRAPAVKIAAARLAEARGLVERAEALVAEALAAGGGCRALELGRDLARRRGAVALEDERARALAACRDGRERLAEHLRRRGDPAGAAEALLPVVRARPWALEPSLAVAAAHLAAGAPGKAVDALEALRAIWPRSPRVEKKLADARELAGDSRGAREARERALRLDPADLDLRRALALDGGGEPLDDVAEDAAAAIRAYEAARRTDDTSSALVLDAAAVEVHPGGAVTERTHQVIHVLDPQGVEQFGEVTLPPGAELIALRTLKPDGRAVEPESVGGGKGTISLAGLEPGDYVRVEWLRGVRGDGGGVAADPFYFRVDGSRLFRSTYVVVAPEGVDVAVDAHGLAEPVPAREGGRLVTRAAAHDVPAHVPEPGQPSATEIFPWVQVGLGADREAVHADLADAAAGRTRSTVELRAFAARVRAEAGADATPAALARAAWARVSREILGTGGAFGADASEALSRGRGSRLLVLEAVLAELGIRSRVALARPFGADPGPRRFPSHATWSHALLRIDAGGETLWHDPSFRAAPLGTVPSPVLGVEALVLPEPGEPLETVRTPERSAEEERREVSIRIALDASGGATVEGEDRYHGAAAAAAKAGVERLDATERRQVIESMLARTFRGLSLSVAEMVGEGDPAAPFTVRWRGAVPSLARAANGGLVLDAPLAPARLGARFVQVAARTTPLLIPVGERVVARVEIVAPEGHAPDPAPAGAVEGPFGTFARSERAEGRTLVREERLVLLRGRIPPDRYPDFAAFAAGVDHLQEHPAVFTKREAAPQPAGSAGPAAAAR
jgi:tetratricopeptide (TPR) repeat protein